MITSGLRESETGEFDPLISSSSSTIRPSKTSFFCFIGFLLCCLLACLLVHNHWELLLSLHNQDHIPTVTTTFWELFPVYSKMGQK